MDKIEDLTDQLKQGRISRRQFILGAASLGLSISGISSLLAACAPAPSQPAGGGEVKGATPAAAPAKAPLPGGAGAKRFDGMEVSVSSLAGPVGLPAELWGKEWEQATGARIRLITFPFGDIHAKYKTAFAAGQHVADVIHFGADFAGDILGGGYTRPMPDYIKNRIDWEDVLPVYRERLLTWGRDLLAAPYDGDTVTLFYRKDVLENQQNKDRFKAELGYDLGVPTTWDQARDVARFFNNWDWAGRGRPSYGIGMQPKPKDSQWFFYSQVAAAYAKHPDDPGFYFDTNTFDVRINSPGFVKALEDWVELVKFGPPGVLNWTWAECRSGFAGQDIFMSLDWADMGTLTYDPQKSQVNGKAGFALSPGSRRVFNPRTGQWDERTEVSYAPFLAWGGWVQAVPKSTPEEKVEASWDLISFLASKELTMRASVWPASGINPSRRFHLTNVDAWVKGSEYQRQNNIPNGFTSRDDANAYLQSILRSLEHPNVTYDLRIPGAFDYFDALDTSLTQAVLGQRSPQDALNDAATSWDAITGRLGGKQKQLEFYRASLGLS